MNQTDIYMYCLKQRHPLHKCPPPTLIKIVITNTLGTYASKYGTYKSIVEHFTAYSVSKYECEKKKIKRSLFKHYILFHLLTMPKNMMCRLKFQVHI